MTSPKNNEGKPEYEHADYDPRIDWPQPPTEPVQIHKVDPARDQMNRMSVPTPDQEHAHDYSTDLSHCKGCFHEISKDVAYLLAKSQPTSGQGLVQDRVQVESKLGQPPSETPKPAPLDDVSGVFAFLLGEAPLDGVWFGDDSDHQPKFWWRRRLRAALSPQSDTRPIDGTDAINPPSNQSKGGRKNE